MKPMTKIKAPAPPTINPATRTAIAERARRESFELAGGTAPKGAAGARATPLGASVTTDEEELAVTVGTPLTTDAEDEELAVTATEAYADL
ncbi:hypothetical protein GQ457_06G003190 [Hibiscus cannabinus]